MNAPQDLPRSAAPPSGDERRRRQAEVVAALAAVLPAHALLHRGEDTTPYECDGLTAYRATPLAVALPSTEAHHPTYSSPCQGVDGRGGRDQSPFC